MKKLILISLLLMLFSSIKTADYKEKKEKHKKDYKALKKEDIKILLNHTSVHGKTVTIFFKNGESLNYYKDSKGNINCVLSDEIDNMNEWLVYLQNLKTN